MSERRTHARALFAPLGPNYDRVGATLSFGQDPRWRRTMVSRVPRDGGTVLDVATGTGLVAERLLAQGHRVTGLDQSADMLAIARRRFGDRVELVQASATEIPFPDASFDHLTFTYLLRYVDDPGATLAELARVVRPGGTIASTRVLRPPRRLATALGSLRRRRPAGGRPGDLARLVRRRPLSRPVDPRVLRASGRSSASSSCGERAGIADVRARRMSLGGGVVIWGIRA